MSDFLKFMAIHSVTGAAWCGTWWVLAMRPALADIWLLLTVAIVALSASIFFEGPEGEDR